MNELLIFALAIIGVIVLIMFFQFINSRRDDKLYLLKLKNDFGKVHRSSYDHDRLIRADAYYRRHMSSGSLDDITWSDMSMDDIYAMMDTTESEAGRQVLYHMLRSPLTDREEVDKRRSDIDFWRGDEAVRDKALITLHHIGRLDSSSVYELIEGIRDIKMPARTAYIVRILLLIAGFALMYPLKGVGVIIFIVVLFSNLYAYYRDRNRILPYLGVYLHVLRLMEASEEVSGVIAKNAPEDADIRHIADETRDILGRMASFRRRSRMALGSETGSNPLYVILNILGIFVYADIIRFGRLKDELVTHEDDIDRLIWLTGSIDALISMAGYVESIRDRSCKSVLTAGRTIRTSGIYHPLIENAVGNSLTSDACMLITGANASGKSTFLKSMALGAIFAQTTGYVCADSYEAPVCLVMSAMSVRDNVSDGDSYYMAEIKAVKRMITQKGDDEAPGILRLCFVDELLNGTNTEERIAAGAQILKSLDRSGVRVMAATHDIELTVLLNGIYDNYHFGEDLSEGDVRFSYKLTEGAATSRNAIRLLGTLGFDDEIIRSAEKMVETHQKEGIWRMD